MYPANLRLGNIEEISAANLAGLNRIRRIKIHREWSWPDQDPILPSDLIAGLPTVERITNEGFQWPTALEMNSLEHACLMEEGGGYIPAMTVAGKVIQHQDRERRDGKTFCIMKVDDETREVPLPTP